MQCVILPETGENFHGNSIETEVQSSQCVGSLFFFLFQWSCVIRISASSSVKRSILKENTKPKTQGDAGL